MYEHAKKTIMEIRTHFSTKYELIEASAVRNPVWPQFADRLWGELLVRHEKAIAMLDTIKDDPLIRESRRNATQSVKDSDDDDVSTPWNEERHA